MKTDYRKFGTVVMLLTTLCYIIVIANAQLLTSITPINKIEYNKQVTYNYNTQYNGLKAIYGNVISEELVCSSTYSKALMGNISSCKAENVTSQKIIDYTPIYQKTDIASIQVSGKAYIFDNKGCYVCDGFLLCIDKKDGYAQNRADKYKCVLRSGETGYKVTI